MSEYERDLYIIYGKEGISEDEKEAVDAYWSLDGEDSKKFLCYVSAAEGRYGLEAGTLSKLVKENYWVTGRYSAFFCVVCGERTFVSSRAEYLRIKKNSKCIECKNREERERVGLEELRLVEELRVQRKFEEEQLQADYSVNDLSYMESIFIFLWLSDKNLSRDVKQIISKESTETITGITELDDQMISQLVAKGVVLVLDGRVKLKDEISCPYDFLEISQEVFLKVSKQYSSAYDLCDKLHEIFCSGNITITDIDEISFAIKSVRLNNLYSVVDWLEKDRRIVIKRNIKLDSLLQDLSSRYSLAKCTYVMFYNAKAVASDIHTNIRSSVVQPHLFTKFTGGYLKRGDEMNLTVRYTKVVPYSVETSVFEALVCDTFFDTEYNWFSLSPKEVLSKWVGVMNVSEENV